MRLFEQAVFRSADALAAERAKRVVGECATMSDMDEDWRDKRIGRLEQQLDALKWDTQRRFRERDEWALRFLVWLIFGLAWGAWGVVLGKAIAGG